MFILHDNMHSFLVLEVQHNGYAPNICIHIIYHFRNQCGGFSGNWESTYLRIQQFHFWNIPKRCSIILQKHLFNYVHNSTICNSQNLETTYVPLNRRMDKEGVVHFRVLLGGKKQYLKFCMQMYGHRKHFTE